MTSEIVRNGAVNGKIVYTALTKWVFGVTAACLLGWMAWVSDQLLEGDRFTATQGEALALRQRLGDAELASVIHADIKAVESRVDKIEAYVAADKVQISEVKRRLTAIDTKLDRILSKLSG